jgi:hypothetical protein
MSKPGFHSRSGRDINVPAGNITPADQTVAHQSITLITELAWFIYVLFLI